MSEYNRLIADFVGSVDYIHPDGTSATESVPISDWIPHPVNDSAEWLDRQAPKYLRTDGSITDLMREDAS